MSEGLVVWVTGPNEDTVARVAAALTERLARRPVPTELIDRRMPGIEALEGPGLDRRVGVAAGLLVRHGVAVVVAVPSFSRAARDAIRDAIGRLIEVYVPGAARADYEAPERAEVQIDFPETELAAACERTMRTLELRGFLPPASETSYSAEEEREVLRRLKSFGYL